VGISMSVYAVSDAEIRALADSAGQLSDFTRGRGRGECYLADCWDGLHFLLTGDPASRALPLAALKAGDVVYAEASDPTHAIFSRTAKTLAGELGAMPEAALRKRFDPRAMLESGVYPGRPWAFPELADSTFRELLVYFDRLRSRAMRAAEGGTGLLFQRYEDL